MEGIEQLDRYFERGEIIYGKDDTSYFERIASSFPVVLNRINWEPVAHISFSVPKPSTSHTDEITRYLHEILTKEDIGDNEMVALFGDNWLEGVFKMKVSTLREVCTDFFTLPQCTYVIPDDTRWCIEYSLEDIMYFGYAPTPSGNK